MENIVFGDMGSPKLQCLFIWFIFAYRKGDYYRYLAEFKTGTDKKEVSDLSLKAYQVIIACT